MTPLLAVQWIGVAAAFVALLFFTVWLTVEATVATVMEARRLGWLQPPKAYRGGRDGGTLGD